MVPMTGHRRSDASFLTSLAVLVAACGGDAGPTGTILEVDGVVVTAEVRTRITRTEARL
jgi:hypothetical protein